MYIKDNKFHLYYIKNNYIEYLRQYDERVYFNKNQKRPYVGTICIFQGQKYFIPMTSPKPKHLKMNPNLADIYMIDSGKLGILNINNMIPVDDDSIIRIDINQEEKAYSTLLNKQIIAINKNKKQILLKISKFFVLYEKNKLYQNILERTCNFRLLEEKCNEWKNKNTLNEENISYILYKNDYRVWAC